MKTTADYLNPTLSARKFPILQLLLKPFLRKFARNWSKIELVKPFLLSKVFTALVSRKKLNYFAKGKPWDQISVISTHLATFERIIRENDLQYLKKSNVYFTENRNILKLCTVWKNEKITVAEKKFRQINSFVNTSFSRNFGQRCVKVNFHIFYIVRSCTIFLLLHMILYKVRTK